MSKEVLLNPFLLSPLHLQQSFQVVNERSNLSLPFFLAVLCQIIKYRVGVQKRHLRHLCRVIGPADSLSDSFLNQSGDDRRHPGRQLLLQNRIHDDGYKKAADELYGRLSQWFYTYADPAVDGAKEGVTGYGQMCRPGIYAEKREKFHAWP